MALNGIKLRRSALFVPASKASAIAKARVLPVDMVILDLEDAVAPAEKAEARSAAAAIVAAGGFGHREVVLRVNSLSSPWGAADLAVAARLEIDGILIPKVKTARDVVDANEAIAGARDTVRLWAMVETCEALLEMSAIARTSRCTRLGGLVVGSNDLCLEMGIQRAADRAPLLHALSATIVAARACGIAALDGVFNWIDDAGALRRECQQGRAFGFDGKTIIHPKQVAVCNEAYSPRTEDLTWANSVLEAFARAEHAGKGAIRVGNEMIELLHVEHARRLLATDEEIRRRQ